LVLITLKTCFKTSPLTYNIKIKNKQYPTILNEMYKEDRVNIIMIILPARLSIILKILFILTSVLSFIVAPFPYSSTNTVMLCYTALVYNITFMIHLQAPLRNFPLTKRGTYKGTSK